MQASQWSAAAGAGRGHLRAVAVALDDLAATPVVPGREEPRALLDTLQQAMQDMQRVARRMALPLVAEHARVLELLCAMWQSDGLPLDAETHRLLVDAHAAQCRIFEEALCLWGSPPHWREPPDPSRSLLADCASDRLGSASADLGDE